MKKLIFFLLMSFAFGMEVKADNPINKVHISDTGYFLNHKLVNITVWLNTTKYSLDFILTYDTAGMLPVSPAHINPISIDENGPLKEGGNAIYFRLEHALKYYFTIKNSKTGEIYYTNATGYLPGPKPTIPFIGLQASYHLSNNFLVKWLQNKATPNSMVVEVRAQSDTVNVSGYDIEDLTGLDSGKYFETIIGFKDLSAVLQQTTGLFQTRLVTEEDTSEWVTFNVWSTGIDDVHNSSFTIYPNPSTENIQINSDVSGTYEVFDLSGQKVSFGTYEPKELITLDLPDGIYFLKVNNNITRRLVIQH